MGDVPGSMGESVEKTKRLIELTKELEELLPNGYMLMFPTGGKTGISTVVHTPVKTPQIFYSYVGLFNGFLEKSARYQWSKPMDQFKTKEG